MTSTSEKKDTIGDTMAKARMSGSGWHKQSVRHSNARKYGRAGGKYSGRFYLENKGKNVDGTSNYFYTLVSRDEKIDFLMKSGLHTRRQLESLDDSQLNDFFRAGLKARGINMRYQKDSDGDGVPDHKDCKPLDPTKQDINPQAKPFYKKQLTEQEVKLLLRRLNAKKISFGDLPENFQDGDGWELTTEQFQKGRDWLLNRWKTPSGVERKNNPFGYREEAILEKATSIDLKDFYPQGMSGYLLPVYRVNSSEGSFEYVVSAGEIIIIG